MEKVARTMLVLTIIASLLDWWFTAQVVGVSASEGNPIMRWLIEYFGTVHAVLIAKLPTLVFFAGLYILTKNKARWAIVFSVIFGVQMLATVEGFELWMKL